MTQRIQTVRLNFPKAHSKKQELIFNAFRLPGVKEIWVNCGTKFGKSISAGICLSSASVDHRERLYRWIAPIYKQAYEIGVKYCRKMLPPEPYTTMHKGDMKLTINDLQTAILFQHAQDPESLEGYGSHGDIHDEAAKQSEEAFASARTTRTFTKGPSGYFSTPVGKNHFYKGCMRAKEQMEYDLRRGKQPEKIFIKARTLDNPFVDKSIIADARRNLPKKLFDQYFNAEFVDDGSVFAGFNQCFFGPKLFNIHGENQIWVHPEADQASVVIGVDWAKHKDYTVFTALRYDGSTIPRLYGYWRFNQMKYTAAVKRLYNFAAKFKQVGYALHDKTGVGDAIDDILSATNINFEGVTFTNASKCSMVNDLIVAFENQSILMPHIPEFEKELEMYEVTVGKNTFVYQAAQGFHDDIVSSLMLAYKAYEQFGSASGAIHYLEDLPNTELDKTTLKEYYQELMEEDDQDIHTQLFGLG